MSQTNTNSEERLRAEIDDLKRQLDEFKHSAGAGGHRPPSKGTLLILALVAIALIVAGFFKGYLPRQRREDVLAAEAKAGASAAPLVSVQHVKRADAVAKLILPGNIQAVTEAPVMARSTGYIRKRNVDIGDRVAAGQVLAEIEAPELDQQIRQAKAAVDQAASAIQQAEASLQQGRTNANLARVTAQRWANLSAKGVVSKQENDTYQAQAQAQQANVQALEKAVAAARSNAAAAEANLARLSQLKTYQEVRAPFAGVITVRNVDLGALVNEGNTMLFRLAQTGRLRTYVNVPQNNADTVRVGQAATLTIPDLPGRKFQGTVARTANALDPTSRTMLVEVQVANADGTLMPGMYTLVDLALPRKDPPMLIPGDTLLVRPDGPQVAVVNPDNRVHFTRLQLGRDYGSQVEVLAGLTEGQLLVVNPSDAIREGVEVKPQAEAAKPAEKQ